MKKLFCLFLVAVGLALAAGLLCGCDRGPAGENGGDNGGGEDTEETVVVVEGFVLTRSEDGQAYFVSGYNGEGGDEIVPSSCNGKPVTEIGDGAFREHGGLVSVEIPASIGKIGANAFEGCTSLASVSLAGSVSEIGESAFAGCTALEACRSFLYGEK